LAGLLAFQGYLNVGGVMFTAFCGAFCGDQFYFYIGRLKGPYLLSQSHSLVRKLRKALRLIHQYGNLVAFTSRYTYGFRIVLPIILGMTPFPSLRFLMLNLASACSWAIIFTSAGYLFGKTASIFVNDIGRYEHYLVLLLASIITVVWCIHAINAWARRRPARNRLKRMRAKGMYKSIR